MRTGTSSHTLKLSHGRKPGKKERSSYGQSASRGIAQHQAKRKHLRNRVSGQRHVPDRQAQAQGPKASPIGTKGNHARLSEINSHRFRHFVQRSRTVGIEAFDLREACRE